MRDIVTADQFVAGIISVLALKDHKSFVLRDTQLDQMFQNAYKELAAKQEELNVTPNFTFFIDPFHGDSVSLRQTLLAAKEKKLIALNNPTFHTFEIKLDDDRAHKYLGKGPLSEAFLTGIVERHFSV